jgi:hypothetical protein
VHHKANQPLFYFVWNYQNLINFPMQLYKILGGSIVNATDNIIYLNLEDINARILKNQPTQMVFIEGSKKNVGVLTVSNPLSLLNKGGDLLIPSAPISAKKAYSNFVRDFEPVNFVTGRHEMLSYSMRVYKSVTDTRSKVYLENPPVIEDKTSKQVLYSQKDTVYKASQIPTGMTPDELARFEYEIKAMGIVPYSTHVALKTFGVRVKTLGHVYTVSFKRQPYPEVSDTLRKIVKVNTNGARSWVMLTVETLHEDNGTANLANDVRILRKIAPVFGERYMICQDVEAARLNKNGRPKFEHHLSELAI